MSKISTTTLGDLIEFQRGYDLPKSNFQRGIVPVISSNGVLGFHNVAKAKAPGLTIGRSGTVGLPHYIEVDFFPHNTCLFIKDFKGNHPRYIYYLIKTLGLNDYKSGSGVPTMNRNHLHPIKVNAYLDIFDQQKIASVLSALDTKIELNNSINFELEEMAKTLYDYWFVQFEFPDKNGKPYKTIGGKMIWNEELKREIPEGWEVKKIKEIATTGSGSTPLKSNKEYYLNGNVPWINSGELNDPFIIEAKKYITQLGMNSSSTKLFKRGTLLIAMYGATAGKVSILDIEACTNQAICSVNLHNSSHRNYLKLVLNDLYEYLINLSTGSARDNLSQDKIKELVVLMPNGLSIEKFDKIIEPIYAKILTAYRENQKLAELRDWLLPMLMNGQVKVS
jgi:type I restriction enzyme S subunit